MPRTKVVNIKFSEEEVARIKGKAEKYNLPPSVMIRRVVLNAPIPDPSYHKTVDMLCRNYELLAYMWALMEHSVIRAEFPDGEAENLAAGIRESLKTVKEGVAELAKKDEAQAVRVSARQMDSTLRKGSGQ